jgi:bla regulator protein BlaR1
MTVEFIINHLWQSSCFGLLASLLAFMLRGNSPKVRYWVWLSASLKFLVPWVLLVSLGSLVPWRVASVTTSTLPDTLARIAKSFSPNPYAAVQTPAQIHWGITALAFLWAAGFIAIVFTRCRSWYSVRAMLRASTPAKLPIAVPALVTLSANEPAVVGFLRPVLVLPALLLERLTPQQLEAVLAHELSHVRRRDNFFAALHMGVEAIFWFHPLVWWIGSRMIEERELACDEEVLRLGCEPTDYARGILTVCEHYSEAPLPCVSGVTGADIQKRLKTILRAKLARELNGYKKLVLALAAMAAIAVPVGLGMWSAPAAYAQSAGQQSPRPVEKLEFEVASVRQNTSVSASMRFPPPANGRFAVENIPLNVLISFAYGVQAINISGAPGWVSSERYDVTAKAAKPDLTRDDYAPMLQALLVDRFRLAAHSEERERSGYTLMIDKTGSKLVAASAPCAEPGAPRDPREPNVVTCGTFFTGPASLDARKMSTPQFASTLSMVLAAPVVDKTGATGVYDIHLEFNPEGTNLTGRGARALDATTDANNPDSDRPSIFTAVQKQLGLRLEPAKVPTKVLVIDHVEMPTEN